MGYDLHVALLVRSSEFEPFQTFTKSPVPLLRSCMSKKYGFTGGALSSLATAFPHQYEKLFPQDIVCYDTPIFGRYETVESDDDEIDATSHLGICTVKGLFDYACDITAPHLIQALSEKPPSKWKYAFWTRPTASEQPCEGPGDVLRLAMMLEKYGPKHVSLSGDGKQSDSNTHATLDTCATRYQNDYKARHELVAEHVGSELGDLIMSYAEVQYDVLVVWYNDTYDHFSIDYVDCKGQEEQRVALTMVKQSVAATLAARNDHNSQPLTAAAMYPQTRTRAVSLETFAQAFQHVPMMEEGGWGGSG